MARSSAGLSMFATNRGRKVKRLLYALIGFGVIMFFVSPYLPGSSSGDSADSSSSSTGSGLQTEAKTVEPVVAPPISRPFAVPVQGGAEGVMMGDLGGDVVEKGVDKRQTNDTGESKVDLSNPTNIPDYQAVVGSLQNFLGAYTTYAPQTQDAKQWAEGLPSVSDGARAQLLEQAKGSWPDLRERQVKSSGKVANESISPVYLSGDQKTVQMRARVQQDYSMGGRDATRVLGYAVTLQSSGGQWKVVAVRGG